MTTQTATFGAGCFWGVEWVYQQVPGVQSVVSGYSGGHAEVVQITFDPDVVSYDQLLEVFWAMHDPTQMNRQGPDVGAQYRSVIFTHTPEQRATAERSRTQAQTRFDRPIATEIADFTAFYPAEDYHQRYYERNGHEPYCHVLPAGLLENLGLVPQPR
jgi:peptide-methionine (S)-S-oxide reductase